MLISESVLNAIRDAVGDKGWIDRSGDLEPYLIEERGLYRGTCDMVVRPASTEEVAKVVNLCAEAGIPIVPHGGNTGLTGAGVPEGGIVLSTSRLNRIREVDPVNQTLTVEAGVILANVQKAASDAGFLFPLSLAAEGSCCIGGNLSTNAGGVAVLRYGNARDLVLGLEVVLADGRIWDGLRSLRKDNTGYDLKHLFIGAEGTLGIITAAVLKLFPKPATKVTAMAASASPKDVIELFKRTRNTCGDDLTAFEMLARFGLELGLRHVAGVVDPFRQPHPYYSLIELTSPQPGKNLRETLEGILAETLEGGHILDAVIAESERQSDELWLIREAIPEAQKKEGGSVKHDISVPVSKIPEFIRRATDVVEKEMPGVRVCPFGHVGDGNIHFNLTQPDKAANNADEKKAFLNHWGAFNRLVHDLTHEMGGSFSAEHGIGRLKREDMERYKSPVELDLMRTVKKSLDPRNIMNPGKVIKI
ncbi:MAG: FAD-binding oxidoreductase [Rhodospirillales bacterium]|nr:FAD-binding oxidoreductase [Rhodospirillales bacterium]